MCTEEVWCKKDVLLTTGKRFTDLQTELKMRVLVKLLGFGFWMLSLNFAQCQECLREDIKYENTQPVAKALYADGETIKVNCMTGYTGMYKLKCEKGEWKQSSERPCAKKKCGHPGDTQHGDFKLIEGTEFVFGATVEYACKKGYEMASRINRRTCRSQGWDNTVPVCEVVTCPAIYTNEDVTASGNTEKGSYGDVIHFECVSSDKKIDRSSDIHCQETGEWSDAVPTCKDITCTAPVISNGSVDQRLAKYEKGAILKYKCDQGFKPREGIPRCAKFGWTLNPECDAIICELKLTAFEVQEINPKGKTIFRAGDSVEITCSEKYWFFFTKETRKSFRCKETGEWDNKPVCEVITCEDPHDYHVDRPYYWGKMKLGEEQSYSCRSGYRKTAEVATCTRDGWTPKPLCTEITCELKSTTFEVQKINPKGKTIFRPGQSVEITCSEKYWFFFTKETRKSFRCKETGEWDNKPVCEEITCEDPHDHHVDRPYYWGKMKLGEEQSYSCKSGYRKTAEVATCTRDGWTPKPLCIAKCGPPPHMNDADAKMRKNEYNTGERVEYKCSTNYILDQHFSKYLTCEEGEWKGNIMCLKPCSVTVEEMNERGIKLRWIDNQNMTSQHDDYIEFVCQNSKTLVNDGLRQKCNDGVMILPKCV